jgi:ATP-dependent helicase HepA
LAGWKQGDRLVHRFNPELGPGLVRGVSGRVVEVLFPKDGTVLRLAAASDALEPLTFRPGSRALLVASGEAVLIDAVPRPGRVRLADGRDVSDRELWPVDVGESLSERLAQGSVDPLAEVSLRLDALHLAALREADGLGSFLGGRITLFPHQLYAAEQATRSDPVRWLLADEVGLGKTVEACLILNRLLRTGRADRTLVVAPDTLTVQWLGELWRKYHQVFVLLDDKRLADVERDHGTGFNPFDAHRRVVIGIERLRESPRLTEQAVQAGVDLLIVDEAHHLRRPPGHPGNADYRAVAPIAALGRHLLLLTATPLEDDVHGYFRLLQLLRPEEFPEDVDFEERLGQGRRLPPCISATRRQDIGGLPPRLAAPVDLSAEKGWEAERRLVTALYETPAEGPLALRRRARRVRRALASGAALEAILDPAESELRELARSWSRADPRVAWLTRQAREWKRRGDKTLVFVAQRESLERIKSSLSRTAHTRVGVFHEDLSPGQRDIEVAQFRLESGPSMLVSTECGGEGRNFQFCTRLVLFDVPWNPMAVEQRIGRLDRIGRGMPVEIVYFLPPPGRLSRTVVDLYEALGLFAEPLAGLERELSAVGDAVESLARAGEERLAPARFDAVIAETLAGRGRIREAAHHQLHADPYRPQMADAILARVPEELEELTRDSVLGLCELLGLHVEEHRAGTRHSVELGTQARVSSLPGVPPGSSFLGTFDRQEAVEDESIDFFASGHPLVEGVLAHLEDDALGRVGLVHARAKAPADEGFGLLAVYKSAAGFDAVAVDSNGHERPRWAAQLTRRPLRSRRVRAEDWVDQPQWPQLVRDMARRLEDRGRPVLLAAVRFESFD